MPRILRSAVSGCLIRRARVYGRLPFGRAFMWILPPNRRAKRWARPGDRLRGPTVAVLVLVATALMAPPGSEASGERLWVSLYKGPAGRDDVAYDVGVSPDGSRLFVTGSSDPRNGLGDSLTVAYDASSGATLWSSRYGGAGGDDVAHSIAVGPGGEAVYVAGWSCAVHHDPCPDQDYATVAYDASTGARLWVAGYDGFGDADFAYAIGISPDGSRVYVTGDSTPADGQWPRYDREGGQALLAIIHQGDHLDVEIEPLTAEFRFDVLGLVIDGLTVESLWIDGYVGWEGLEPASDLIVVGRDVPILRFSVRPTPAQDFSRPFEVEWLSMFGEPVKLTILPPSGGTVEDTGVP